MLIMFVNRRQAGILAGAGLYAIENNWARMKEDHENAKYLGEKLEELGFTMTAPIETNMLFVNSQSLGLSMSKLAEHLKTNHQIVLLPGSEWDTRIVVHLQTPRHAIDLLLEGIRMFKKLHG
jgi:Threonine aldolase